jgi:hypothetical protein
MSLPQQIHVDELEEFRVKTGDRRSLFLNYMLSLPNCTIATKSKTTNLTKRNAIVFQCNHSKRSLLLPNPKMLSQTPSAPLLIIPALMRSASTCTKKDASAHLYMFLYNTLTHQLERIDIKKYHLEGFDLTAMLKQHKNKLIQYLETVYKTRVSLQPEHDVPFAFAKRIGKESLREAFPVYLIAYLHTRTQFFNAPSHHIHSKVGNMAAANVAQHWQHYVDFNKAESANYTKCPNLSFVKNFATNRCTSTTSRKYLNNLVNPPARRCKGSSIFNRS